MTGVRLLSDQVDNKYLLNIDRGMKPLDWNPEKSAKLLVERGFAFEEIQIAIEEGGLLDVVRYGNPEQYPDQMVLIVLLKGYVCAVPFVDQGETWFLKTAFPSRKYTKQYCI